LGKDGSRGLSHPRVDRHGRLPAGTTSYYFRTRKALLQGVAERLTELDLADLAMMDELSDHFVPEYAGTIGLARLVMLSAQEPYLTRSRARFELILHARRDPDLAMTTQHYSLRFYSLAREVIARWYGDTDIPAAHIEGRAVAVLTYISGVMLTVVAGTPVINDAADLDVQICQLLHSEVSPQYR
jgi:AcrR family transcriptional regulator